MVILRFSLSFCCYIHFQDSGIPEGHGLKHQTASEPAFDLGPKDTYPLAVADPNVTPD